MSFQKLLKASIIVVTAGIIDVFTVSIIEVPIAIIEFLKDSLLFHNCTNIATRPDITPIIIPRGPVIAVNTPDNAPSFVATKPTTATILLKPINNVPTIVTIFPIIINAGPNAATNSPTLTIVSFCSLLSPEKESVKFCNLSVIFPTIGIKPSANSPVNAWKLFLSLLIDPLRVSVILI